MPLASGGYGGLTKKCLNKSKGMAPSPATAAPGSIREAASPADRAVRSTDEY